jgi:hypothetical protein
MRNVLIGLAVCGLTVLAAGSSFAWNSTGHRTVAYIAYQQLPPETRKRVADLLKNHPAAETSLWSDPVRTNGSDPLLNLFLNAATFPDDVRPPNQFHDPAFKHFHRPLDHYVNFTYTPPSTTPGDSSGGNLPQSFVQNLATVKNSNADPAVRATALSWVFHQVGDVHQPLHSALRISAKFPDGDKGGNNVAFPNPRNGGNEEENELHAYWDNLLGADRDVGTPAKFGDVAQKVLDTFPRTSFKPSELKPADDLNLWVMESFSLAVEKVYTPLGKAADGTDNAPGGYEDTAETTGQRRIAQAGYRLAEVLKVLFPPTGSGDTNTNSQ